jgi:hypothetical protein
MAEAEVPVPIKKKSTHGGYRPGAGRKKRGALKPYPAEIKEVSADSQMTPLEYMMRVMCDPQADEARRDRMAVAAAPYVHEKKIAADTRVGKKEAALARAAKPDTTTMLGALMAQKQQLDRDRDAVN